MIQVLSQVSLKIILLILDLKCHLKKNKNKQVFLLKIVHYHQYIMDYIVLYPVYEHNFLIIFFI
jgi:hypothetical protein